jgi:hypothetical protein
MKCWTALFVSAALGLGGGAAAAQGHESHGTGKETARAHATIKGEGITGTAELVETSVGTGKEVMVTISVRGVKLSANASRTLRRLEVTSIPARRAIPIPT